MRAVLDANIVVSGIARYDTGHSSPVHILRTAVDRQYVLVLSEPILAEVATSLEKSYFGERLDDDYRAQKIRDVRSVALIVPLDEDVRGIATHWQDDVVLATAVSGDADYLVTGDKELLALEHPWAFRIVHPSAFFQILSTETESDQ